MQESVLNCRGQNVFSVKTQLQHTFSTLLGRDRSFSRKLNNLNLDISMRSCDGLKKTNFLSSWSSDYHLCFLIVKWPLKKRKQIAGHGGFQ